MSSSPRKRKYHQASSSKAAYGQRDNNHGQDSYEADSDENDDGPDSGHFGDIARPERLAPNKAWPGFDVVSGLFQAIEDKLADPVKPPIGFRSKTIERSIENFRGQCGNDLYPLIRLLLPDRDNRRRTYQLKEAKLARALIAALGVPESSPSARDLINWKIPSPDQRRTGDFASAVFHFVSERSLETETKLSILKINEWLDKLSSAGSYGRRANKGKKRYKPLEEQARLFSQLSRQITAKDFKWLIRIILKDLKIGLSERNVIPHIHKEAMSLYNTCSDLLKVCYTLYDPFVVLEDSAHEVKIGDSFRPMLCARVTEEIPDVVKKLKKQSSDTVLPPLKVKDAEEFEFAPGELLIEEKLDGERIQLHKRGNTYKYFSRTAKDYTYLYGGTTNEGSLTPYIHDQFFSQYEDLILDGEMLVWDPILRKYMPFGQLKTFAKQDNITNDSTRPCFKVFDVLLIKEYGKAPISMLKASLRTRRYELAHLFTPKEGYLELLEHQKVKTAKCVTALLEEILESKGEGVVLKNPCSTYVLGGREPTWVKIKPDYMDQLSEEVEAQVIGGFWGQGRRGGRLASFLVGLKEGSGALYAGEEKFLSFVKVGSGFSMTQYADIMQRTEGKWFNYRKGSTGDAPAWFKTVSEWPDMLIKPSESFMIKIKAAEIVMSTEFATVHTLRFPRCIAIEGEPGEKAPKKAMKLDDFKAMQAKQKKAGADGWRVKRKPKKSRVKKPIVLGLPKQRALRGDVGKIFEGLVFYVHDGSIMRGIEIIDYKPEIERLIDQHGGERRQTQVPDENGMYISHEYIPGQGIGGMIRWDIDKKDIISPQWVRDCSKAGRRLPLTKQYYVKATEKTMQGAEYNMTAHEVAASKEDSDLDPDAVQMPDKFASDDEAVDSDDDDGRYSSGSTAPHRSERDSLSPELAERLEHAMLNPVDPTPSSPVPMEEDFVPTAALASYPYRDHKLEINAADDDQEDGNSEPETESDDDDIEIVPVDPTAFSGRKPGMGAGLGKVDFDSDKGVFDAYVAYFDTYANARKNSLTIVDADNNPTLDGDLAKAEKAFTANGGQVTLDIDNSALTHVVHHDRRAERVAELVRRTKFPRYRRVCSIDEWIKPTLESAGIPF